MPPLIDDPTLGSPATEADIQQYKDNILQLLKVDLPKVNADYKDSLIELEALKDILDNGNFVTSTGGLRHGLLYHQYKERIEKPK